jgi:hypothetical protein
MSQNSLNVQTATAYCRSRGNKIESQSLSSKLNYPRLRVVGFFPFGVAVVEPVEAGAATFSFCFPFVDFFVGAFQ